MAKAMMTARAKNREVIHGTPWAYNSGCRCAFCTTAIALYRRAMRSAPPQEQWWPTARSLYVCACDFTAECSASWTFERVPHECALAVAA